MKTLSISPVAANGFRIPFSANRIIRIFFLTGFVLLATAALSPAMAQRNRGKSPLQLAEYYYASGEYYTAARLYEQALHPTGKRQTGGFPVNRRRRGGGSASLSRRDIQYKQAESYRLAYFWKEAAAGYKACVDKDPVRYREGIYWQAVCARALGNLKDAADLLRQYLGGNGRQILHAQEAQKELTNLTFATTQLNRRDTAMFQVKKVNIPNSSDRGLFAASRGTGGLMLVSSTETDQNPTDGVNPNTSRLYFARLEQQRMSAMNIVALPLTDHMTHQGAASMCIEGNRIYFTQWKLEKGEKISKIYQSTKRGGHWSTPELVSALDVPGSNSQQPFCTADGRYLLFASDRPGGLGKLDIWIAPFLADGSIGKPVNAGPAVNTAEDEVAPFYHLASSSLVFSSLGHQGMGGFDFFVAKGPVNNWQQAENMGYPVNSTRDDVYFMAGEDGNLLDKALISSDRGEGCCLETYTVTKQPKDKRLFGLVLDCQTDAPVPNAKITITDPSGQTWQTTTDERGRYHFDLIGGVHTGLRLKVEHEGYKDTASAMSIDKTDDSDWKTTLYQNEDLCLLKKLVVRAENVVTVYFDFDMSNVKRSEVTKMDSIYDILKSNPRATVQISGYTDSKGSVEYNKRLSDRRARSCANYLISKGIDARRITFESFGECCPVEMEIINGRDNAAGRAKNRRALININKD